MDLRYIANRVPPLQRVRREWEPQWPYLEDQYRMGTIAPNENFLEAWALRFGELQQALIDGFNLITRAARGGGVTLTVWLQSPFGVNATLEREDGHFGMHRRFTSIEMIETYFYDCAVRALENLDTSEHVEVDLDEIDWVANYVVNLGDGANPEPIIARGGNLKKRIKRTLGQEVEGLAKYVALDGYCGYFAILYLLCSENAFRDYWTGSLGWFDTQFSKKLNYPYIKQLKTGKKRATLLCRELALQIAGDREKGEWILTQDTNTAKDFVQAQPKYQVVIYNEVIKEIMFQYRGHEFDPALAKHTTILLSLSLGHVQLIHTIGMYLTSTYEHATQNPFCYLCFKFGPARGHVCENRSRQCQRCYFEFPTQQLLKEHCEPFSPVECHNCLRQMSNELCLRTHTCREQDRREKCKECGHMITGKLEYHKCEPGFYKCVSCLEMVEKGHRCFIQTLKEPEYQSAAEAGCDYYAFDLESMIGVETLANGFQRHVVNLCVVQRCFSADPPLVFESLERFIAWAESLKCRITLWAHNLKGYDGRLIFDYLFETNRPATESMWRGLKVWYFDYGPIRFADTLLHISAASLSQLPAMFGLDQTQFKKGYFPHLFNRPENQNYVGQIPDRAFFGREDMRAGSAQAFDKWYAEQAGVVWDFKQELKAYCISDTLILARAMEAYMAQQMSGLHCLNPFSKMTIASYAMAMYRTYFMPENTLARLSSQETDYIRQSMHGGRTDTRCLIREWTPEEVDSGIYGMYQDVQSLYPTVQFYDPLPVGHPTFKVFLATDQQPAVETLNEVFGFVCCDIEPTRYLHHPILVHNDPQSGKLLCDLKAKTRLTVPTPELHLALQHGYRVTKVYWWYHFDSSTELFKSYFRQFLAGKLKASGVPSWVTTDEHWLEFQSEIQKRLGIELHREDMVKNAAAKTGAKLLCNSLWGKFGERLVGTTAYVCFNSRTDVSKVMALEMEHINGKIQIKSRLRTPDAANLLITYERLHEPDSSSIWVRKHLSKTNIALASMVTSHARCRLWAELNRLGDRVLYHDTDSIIYEHRPHQYSIPEGRYLGEWEDELDGKPMTAFVSIGPKSYAYRVAGKETVKMKGMHGTTGNAELLKFEDMKRLALEDGTSVKTLALLFRYDRNKRQMSTGHSAKLIRNTYDKGWIHPQTYKVYPFGWERFLDPETMAEL